MSKHNFILVFVLFAMLLGLGFYSEWKMIKEVNKLDQKVEQFINQDIEVEYNYFLWLHERELVLEGPEMELYMKLKNYYKLPEAIKNIKDEEEE